MSIILICMILITHFFLMSATKDPMPDGVTKSASISTADKVESAASPRGHGQATKVDATDSLSVIV